MVKKTSRKKLSIVIVSYNTKDILRDCLLSLEEVKNEVNFEVFVSDNGSIDKSVEMVKKQFDWVNVIENNKNLGFARGNNAVRDLVKGEYVLFLNSDTLVHKNTLLSTINFMDQNKDVGSVSCRVVLPNGDFDKDTRRSFPTPWVALTHIAIPIDKLFPKSKLFAKYWYGFIPDNQPHEVDVIQGAFHLTRKSIFDKIGWFDEDYFLDGEDIDICWRIKAQGWKIMYYPKVSITHVKKASKKKPNAENKKIFTTAGVNAMEIFYRKHLWEKYPVQLNYLVILGIRLVKILRLIKLKLK
ncbi:glycosyltransferase family 2 protein [Candidatus Woesebacteria bacterium]|nr:MAG: glycosyltransferase family 2 protein [Candidatus Woesebacteria bacterium]